MTKLLIVDDSREMRELIKNIVGKECHEVFECEDGDEVLAAFTAHRPDWVLMDVEMKQVDGIAATRQIKAAFPEAQIVIVTNYDDATLREAAQVAGACGYVLKENLLDLRLLLQSSTCKQGRDQGSNQSPTIKDCQRQKG
jgi:CheY-like chemotaxis protein